jgi:hypothetical protein
MVDIGVRSEVLDQAGVDRQSVQAAGLGAAVAEMEGAPPEDARRKMDDPDDGEPDRKRGETWSQAGNRRRALKYSLHHMATHERRAASHPIDATAARYFVIIL